MAREVHDTVAQGLVSILLQLRAADGALAGGQRRGRANVALARRPASRRRPSFEETRRSVLGLAPSPLEGRTNEEALFIEIAWANRTGVIDARLVTAGKPDGVPAPEVAHTLFRIAQEALTNAIRHARATSVPVGLVYSPHRRHPPGAGRRRGVRSDPARRRGRAARSGARAVWPSEPDCSAVRSISNRRRDGARGSVPGSRPSPTSHETPDGMTDPVRILVVDDHAVTQGRHREPAVENGSGAPRRGRGRLRGTRPSPSGARCAPTSCSWTCRCSAATGSTPSLGSARKTPSASVVALTAFASDELVAGAFRAGARGYIGKEGIRGRVGQGPFAPPPAEETVVSGPATSGSIPSSTARAT